MASRLHPSTRRSSTPPVVATTNDGDLPLDLLFEILVRLPTKPICRFRIVCKSWRTLLYHPEFITAAHNPGPLLAIGLKEYSSNEVHILDMESGDAVKNVNIATNNTILYPCGEARHMSDDTVVCLVGPHNRLRLIDLASGDISILPNHAPQLGYNSTLGIIGHAHAYSTGETKVLAIDTRFGHQESEVCKILTLGISKGFWRDTGSPPLKLSLHSRRAVVINGFAYLLTRYAESNHRYPHRITVFDFNKEAWRPAASSLQGPANCRDICLAKLDRQLVACNANGFTSIELWFLVDLDRSIWIKRYTIPMSCCEIHQQPLRHEYFEKPLAVLDDGRIVMLMGVHWQESHSHDAVLRIYNPRTKTFKDGTRVSKCSHFSVIKWSLLHSGQKSPLDIAAKSLLLVRGHNKSGATLCTD